MRIVLFCDGFHGCLLLSHFLVLLSFGKTGANERLLGRGVALVSQ